MEWNVGIDLPKRKKFTSKLIEQRALARGWQIKGFKTNQAIFLIYIPGREKPIKIFSASPPQMSYTAAKISNDKYITNQILADNGVPVPKEMLVDIAQPLPSEALHEFLESVGKVVVKPLDSAHGKGITVNVQSIEELEEALKEAKEQTAKTLIVVQEQLEGEDVRVVCIDYKFVDAISRIPAYVIGDGHSTISELIIITNQSDDRGENYKAKLNFIPVDKVERYLGSERLQEVPAEGEKVQVIGISNIGTGGIRKNIKDQIPEALKQMASKVAEVLDLPVCGVDFIVSRIPESDTPLAELQPRVIEANECPSLVMYDNLDSPEQSGLIDQYLDYLAKY